MSRSDWIQVVSSLAIVVGIVLVVWELRQNREITNEQFTHSNISDTSNDYVSIYGEDAASVLSKACFQADSLENRDLVILDRYFRNQVLRIVKVRFQSSFIGDEEWRAVGRTYLAEILRYPQGTNWLNFYSGSLRLEDVRTFLREEASKMETPRCDTILDTLR